MLRDPTPAIISEITAEHAREASLLWTLWRDDRTDADLRDRLIAHLDGLVVGAAHGTDPFAVLPPPWRESDLFPIAWLARTLGRVDLAPQATAAADDPLGAEAVADAAGFAP